MNYKKYLNLSLRGNSYKADFIRGKAAFSDIPLSPFIELKE